MAQLTYFGHSAVSLEASGIHVLIDPFIKQNPLATTESLQGLEADFVIVTHAHSDHLGDAIEIAKRCKAKVISTFEVASYAAQQGCETEQMHIGGSIRTSFGRVKLTQAFHSSSMEIGGKLVSIGNPCGVVVSLGDKHVYHAGDTGLFGDMRLIGEDVPLDIALLPIGDRFTMGIKDAVKAASFLNAKLNVPIHYRTWGIIDVDPNEFVERCSADGLNAQIVVPGTSIEF